MRLSKQACLSSMDGNTIRVRHGSVLGHGDDHPHPTGAVGPQNRQSESDCSAQGPAIRSVRVRVRIWGKDLGQ